ncbi:MAG TPA: cytochrome c-type biogenesis protein [Albitalea sp.]|nr:cytochrome c-type biogenesis protein [Albitalea sp.]
MRRLLHAAVLVAVLASAAQAKEALPAATDPVLEQRMMTIATELRCLVCQNQTIADSQAALALDLREQVREMLRQGRSDRQVIDYMTARYGDFALYRPPFKATTALLWAGPPLLVMGGLGVLALVLVRRNRLAPERFEAEPTVIDEPREQG